MGRRAILEILPFARQSAFQQPCCIHLLQAISSPFHYLLPFSCKCACDWNPPLVQEPSVCFLFSWAGMPLILAGVTTPSQRSKQKGQGWLQQQLISPCQGLTKNMGSKGVHSEAPADWLYHDIKEEQNWDLRHVAEPFINQEVHLEVGWLWWQLPFPSSNLMPVHMGANHTQHTAFPVPPGGLRLFLPTASWEQGTVEQQPVVTARASQRVFPTWQGSTSPPPSTFSSAANL